jgi:hypothetical protein
MASSGGSWKSGSFAKAGGASATAERPKRGDLDVAEMRNLVPENAGNSRIYAASQGLANGSLKTQDGLRGHDIQNHLGQLNGLTSRQINMAAAQDGGSVKVAVGTGMTSVSRSDYRQFAAQANRDAFRIYRNANSDTKDSWARELQGSYASSRNPTVRRIARDLSQRYDRIMESEARARKAARAAARAAAQ